MVEIKEVFEVIGYFLLLDKQVGFFWFCGSSLEENFFGIHSDIARPSRIKQVFLL